MANIVCPECGSSAIVNHKLSCSRPEYVDLRHERFTVPDSTPYAGADDGIR